MSERLPRVPVELDTIEELVSQYDSHLSSGAVVTTGGADLAIGTACEVVLIHPRTGLMHPLSARVTSKTDDGHAVCQIEGFSAEIDAEIREFSGLPATASELASAPEAPRTPPSQPVPMPVAVIKLKRRTDDGVEVFQAADTDVDGFREADTAIEILLEGETAADIVIEEAEPVDELEPPVSDDDDEVEELAVKELDDDADEAPTEDESRRQRHNPATLMKRLRALPQHEVYKLARRGNQAERIALERIYGKGVWETLLRNPNLSPPEVARIARMGTLPKPLIDVIVDHAGWLSKSLVRRALLSNPRLTGRALNKVLRALPKSELKVVPQQRAYPYRVREAAKRLIGRS